MFKFVIINNIMIEKILYSYALKYSRFWTNSSKNAITMLTYLSPKRKKLYTMHSYSPNELSNNPKIKEKLWKDFQAMRSI